MHSYLLGVLFVGFVLSWTRALGISAAPMPVLEEHKTLAYAPQPKSDDAIGREIRRHDEAVEIREPSRPPRLVAYSQIPNSSIDRAMVSAPKSSVRVSPLFGALRFEGAWGDHVSSHFATGLLLSRSLIDALSMEMDFGFSRFSASYSGTAHTVHQANTGAGFRLNLVDSFITPYVAGGFGLNYFTGLSRGPYFLGDKTYNQWLISGVVSLGAEVALTREISIGARGSYFAPAIHRPITAQTGSIAAPSYEDAAMLNTGFYKLMGLVSIAL